jgi:prophage tail gpP-like protein
VYRDDPLDDELELRAIVGDDPVDRLVAASAAGGRTPLEVALDVLRVLQGWVDEDAAGRWFTTAQRRLDGRDPVAALVVGDLEEVEDAARAWAAAHG